VILVLNCGSSSLKYRLVDLDAPADGRAGLVEHVGEPDGVPDHRAALEIAAADVGLLDAPLRAVGHRVVHGGMRFRAPTVIDDDAVAALHALEPLAPLHNPANVTGIEVARALRPDVPHVAVFDTAFHADLPPAAATYALDTQLNDRYGIRRYGFHGTSIRYVVRRTASVLGQPLAALNMIVLHLGNGASATAVAAGRSVETSMGFTPLEGLVMGTRAGDLDSGVVTFLLRQPGFDADRVDSLLQHGAGLLGLCGDNDMRAILARRAAGDATATLAFGVYCHRVRKYVGAYHAVLGRLDVIVFTGGVGEHAAPVRSACLDGLSMWGITVDAERNAGTGDGARVISPDGAPVAVCVVPTDEEAAIASETAELLRDLERQS